MGSFHPTEIRCSVCQLLFPRLGSALQNVLLPSAGFLQTALGWIKVFLGLGMLDA